MTKKKRLGLIGFGAFGKLIYPYLCRVFDVIVFDIVDVADRSINTQPLTLCAACDCVVLAVPVQVLEEVAREIAPYIKPGAIVLDVGSVKVLPARVLHDYLPDGIDVICTHPLFGPQSAANGLAGLKVVVCPIRGRRTAFVKQWLESLSLKVYETTPDDHDRQMATTQGITHLIANVMTQMAPWPQELTTPSFDHLVRATEMVRYDSNNVFRAIERDNPYAAEVRKRFFELAEELKTRLDRG